MKQTNSGKVNKALKGIVLLRNVAILLLAVVCAFSGSTVAWISGSNEIQPQVASSVITNYFEFGEGTEANPFIIHSPRHLYNLAWLQYLGQFNKAGESEYYFKICPHAGENPCANSSAAEGDGSASTVLDMTGWILPPIGTPQFPFLGNFDGNGCTISNLTVTDNYDAFTDPGDEKTNFVKSGYTYADKSCGAVGLFGVVGPIGGSATGSNAVYDVNIKNLTASASASDKSLVGIAAAYVNAPVSGVTITGENTSVSSVGGAMTGLGAANASNYSLVGYCTPDYRGTLKVSEVNVMEPETYAYQYTYNAKGNANAGDGSINMEDMHNRLAEIYTNNNYASRYTYYSTETRTYSDPEHPNSYVASNQRNRVTPSYTFEDTNNYNRRVTQYYKHYASTKSGSFSFSERSNKDSYLYLNGGANSSGTQTLHIIRYNYMDAEAIGDGLGHYLKWNIDSGLLESVNELEDATGWIFSGSDIYTVYKDSSDNQITRYLVNVNDNLVISESASTVWDIKTSSISCVGSDGSIYNIGYNDGEWNLMPEQQILIGQIWGPASEYLTVEAGSITSVTDVEIADDWAYSASNLYVKHDGVKYYLYNSDGYNVSLTTDKNAANDTEWIVDENYVKTSDSKALQFNGSEWVLADSSICILDGTRSNFLNLDTYALVNCTDSALATRWEMDASGKITNNVGYSLKVSGGKLSATKDDTASSWIKDPETGRLYVIESNQGTNPIRYYLIFDGKNWTVTSEDLKYYLIGNSAENRWMTVDGTNIITTTDKDAATVWIYDGTYLFTYINGSRYNFYGTGTWLVFFTTYTPSLSTSNKVPVTINENNNTISAVVSVVGRDSTVYFNVGTNFSIAADSSKVSIKDVKPETPSDNAYGKLVQNVLYDLIIEIRERTIKRIKMQLTDIVEHEDYTTTTAISSPPPTYFPLAVKANDESDNPVYDSADDFYASMNNTGYVVSGKKNEHGDIRVSKYPLSSISSNYRTTFYTHTFKGTGTINANNISNIDFRAQYGLEKFASSYPSYKESTSDSYYGLHFMDSLISEDNKIKVDYACILNEEYVDKDYELPESSIDFVLNKSGFINFYAGTYFSSNDTFFSLHKVDRNPDDPTKIDRIREIETIYGRLKTKDGVKYIDTSDDYEYKYKGESLVLSDDHKDYVPIFQTSWITTNPTDYTKNRLYYFEIPANAGEYCLGSVENHDGAYLIYLDLCTNGQLVNREEVQECWTVTDYDYEYAKGVELVSSPTETAINAGKFALTLPEGINSTSVSKRGTDITYSPEIGSVTCLSGNLSANGKFDVSGGEKSVPEVHKRVTYYDTNAKGTVNYKSVFDYVDGVVTYKIYEIEDDITQDLINADKISVDTSDGKTTINCFTTSVITWSEVGNENTNKAVLTYRYDKPAKSVDHVIEYSQVLSIDESDLNVVSAPIKSEVFSAIKSGISNRNINVDVKCDTKFKLRITKADDDYDITVEEISASEGLSVQVN